MEVIQKRTINVHFSEIDSFIIANKDVKKLIFIDPIVLANQSRFLDLEQEQTNLTLVPTNLNESNKNFESLMAILTILEEKGIGRRNDMVYAIGGGAMLDTVAMACSIYRRGIHIVKVPTTLLSIVDAAIGIKTGINYLGQRNRIGSYHFDYTVVADPRLMNGLQKSLVRQGLGEIFKIAIIKSEELFDILSDEKPNLEDVMFYSTPKGIRILEMSIQLMLEELHENPREENLKRCVDFGHSFSPLVEMESISRKGVKSLPHGYSVAFDCILTATISMKRGLLNTKDYKRILSLYMSHDFGFTNDIYKDDKLLWSSFLEMTKHRGGAQNFPIPIAIGKYRFIQDITYEEVKGSLLAIQKEIEK